MATFVIVHGGWGGGWEWGPVADRLREGGHDVFTPTLTGLGERAHLGGPDVDLETHVQDVVATLGAWGLDDVVLAGQSYGGMVVTGVADRVPDLVRRIVYIDAFVPEDGQSCNDLCGPGWTEKFRTLAQERGDGWRVPLPFEGSMGLSDDVAAWYVPRLVAHPLRTLDSPVRLTGAGEHLPRTYLRFLEEPGVELDDPLAGSARMARERGWDYVEVVGPHDLHVEDPDRMADLLASTADPEPAA